MLRTALDPLGLVEVDQGQARSTLSGSSPRLPLEDVLEKGRHGALVETSERNRRQPDATQLQVTGTDGNPCKPLLPVASRCS